MFGRLGLNTKLTLFTLAVLLSSLLVTGVTYVLYDRHSYRQTQLNEVQVLAGVIADRVTAGLLFNDTGLAAEGLAALGAQATVTSACVATQEGTVLAVYRRDTGEPVCKQLFHADTVSATDNYLLVVKRVIADGEALGEIQIRSGLQELNKRLNRIVGFVVLVAMAATLIVLLVSRRLQHRLTRPILDLSDMARTVARDKDYSVRVDSMSEDELGVLVDAFNGMLETIEMQNRRLMESHQRLEALIVERTAALEKAQASLLRQERLATLGKLTGTVSHELRNPLGTIQTSVDVLRHSLPSQCSQEVDHTLQRIERNIHRCETIINELLDYSRNSPPHRQSVQVDAWLRDVLAGYPHPLRIACERIDVVSAEFDPERLRRALLNVLDNAWHACKERQSATDAACVHISVRAESARLEITVADNGVGMSEEVFASVFEPLFSTRAFGIGLGLAIVKQILEQHGGGVEIGSVPGQGTRVCLWLPWREENAHGSESV